MTEEDPWPRCGNCGARMNTWNRPPGKPRLCVDCDGSRDVDTTRVTLSP